MEFGADKTQYKATTLSQGKKITGSHLFVSACVVDILVNLLCCWHTDTVPHPGTVVVELGDAAVAHGAVFGPDGLPYLEGKSQTSSQKWFYYWYCFPLYIYHIVSQNLPSRYCRICSDPGCLSLPAPQLSGERKQETKAGFKKKKKADRDMTEKWMNNWEIHLAKVYLAT